MSVEPGWRAFIAPKTGSHPYYGSFFEVLTWQDATRTSHFPEALTPVPHHRRWWFQVRKTSCFEHQHPLWIMKLATGFLFLFTLFRTHQAMTTTSGGSLKRILVTGGNKGIGKAICERLLQEWKDTHVYLGSRDVERGQEAVADIINKLGGDCKSRLAMIQIDTSDDQSVQNAAAKFEGEDKLYGIINNAGIGWGYTMEQTVNTNYFGPRRVNEAFAKHLERPGCRIVNVASASGPNFVAEINDKNLKEKLGKPWTIQGGIKELDEMARNMKGDNAYGASKALLNAYNVLYAKMNKDLVINACTPGFIKTDMTSATSATNPPHKGAVPPCWLMMDEKVPDQPTGRYYGSDCVRSPLHVYRGPGDAPYVSDEDLVELPASAMQEL